MKKFIAMAFAALLSACSLLPQNGISGTYQGTLPCADCEKIEAKLVLNRDKTYQYHTVFYKKSQRHPFSEQGNYVWDSQKPNVIRLTESGNLALRIADNSPNNSNAYLEICDPNGNPSANPHYRLMKVSD